MKIQYSVRFNLFDMAKERTITFIVTKDCQLVCKYCYLVGKNKYERMPFEVAKEAIDKILTSPEYFPEKKVTWDFIGGTSFGN